MDRFIDTEAGDNQAEEVATRVANVACLRFMVVVVAVLVDCMVRLGIKYVVAEEKTELRLIIMREKFVIQTAGAVVAVAIIQYVWIFGVGVATSE